MGKLSVEILDALQLTQKKSFAKLSILLGMDSFVFMITDTQGKVVALKHYDFPETITNPIELGRRIQPLFVEDELLKASYDQVFVAIDVNQFTIVPEFLFKDSQAEKYLQQVTTVSENDKVRVDRLPELKAKLVYKIDKGIHFLLKLHYPECKIFHLYTAFLTSIRQQNELLPLNGKYVFVNAQVSSLNIAVFNQQNLLLANSYRYQAPEDCLYFVSLIFEQFELDQEKTPVFLSGLIDPKGDLVELLFDRLSLVRFVEWALPGTNKPAFKQQPIHHYFTLGGLAYCA